MSIPFQRREFLRTGFAAVGAAMFAPLGQRAWGALARMEDRPAWTPVPASCPILRIPISGPVFTVDGLPFAPTWFGDSYPSGGLPFHNPESPRTWAQHDEYVDVAIIGGGLSGLATAHAIRDRDWMLFDVRSRFGGSAMGESWNHLPYSMGSAYFMVPDDDSYFDRLYRSLGVYDLARVDSGSGFRLEFGGRIVDDVCQDCSPREEAALASYAKTVQYYANRAYPDIPWSDGASRDLVRALDTQYFHQAVIDACGGEVPPLLAKAVQAYCFSSFGVGWDELSAAAGWNFIAAEEFGRIVLPGGNAGLATLLWQDLTLAHNSLLGRPRMRAGCMVTDVRLEAQGVSLAWRDAAGRTHTLGAKQVVYAGPKHIFGHMMPSLEAQDPEKWDAIHAVPSVAYLVANVLLTRRVHEEFYDLFAIHDDQFPMDDGAFELDRRITDAVNGTFAVASSHPHGDVLTLYWPLPWHTARFTIVNEQSYVDYAALAAPQIKRLLEVVGIGVDDVSAVRLTRWGHAMPYARPGTYAGNLCDVLRRPVSDRIWFANQDNWLLPAVETCLGEAAWVAKHL